MRTVETTVGIMTSNEQRATEGCQIKSRQKRSPFIYLTMYLIAYD